MNEIDDDLWPMRSEDDDELLGRRESRHRHRGVPDFVRRAIENTMDSVHTTQNVSREALQFFLSTTDKTKREVVRVVASEVGDFLRQVDFSSEVMKILTGVRADVQVSVRFRRTEDGVEPEVTAKRDTSSDRASGASPAPEEPKP